MALVRKYPKADRLKSPEVMEFANSIVDQFVRAIEDEGADTVIIGSPHQQCFLDEVRAGLDAKGYQEINLMGVQALGLGLGTLIHERGVRPDIVTGHDFRAYSASIKLALIAGMQAAGLRVKDIGLALSPMAYFGQFELDATCVAMVTASHNENGWTGVKMGANPPLTFGPDEIGRLKEIVLNGQGMAREGGKLVRVEDFREKYIADVASKVQVKRPLKVVCACGNGTAGAFAPDALRRMGVEVIEMDTDLDYTFPKYNPNPEDHAMLVQMAERVKETGADLALGFDGDGDRCGVVDDTGEEIFADKIGLMLARDLSKVHPNSTFVVDVKLAGLYKTDEILKDLNAHLVPNGHMAPAGVIATTASRKRGCMRNQLR